MNLGQGSNFTSKARRFTRRLSYNISKVFREWNRDNNDDASLSKSLLDNDKNSKIFSIDELLEHTRFTKDEIKSIYRDFKQKCPNGTLTEKALSEIYGQLFPCGSTAFYAKHMYSAIEQQVNVYISPRKPTTEINFKEFLIALSSLMRGTLDDKIRWLFNFYDINRDGKITYDEISSMINSLYDLMGPNVCPPVDDYTKIQHIECVIEKLQLGLSSSEDFKLSYEEFYELFSNNKELIEKMMAIY